MWISTLDKKAYRYFRLDFVSPLLLKVRGDIPKHGNTENEKQTSIQIKKEFKFNLK